MDIVIANLDSTLEVTKSTEFPASTYPYGCVETGVKNTVVRFHMELFRTN